MSNKTVVTVARDPFARMVLVRFKHDGCVGCSWCGSQPRMVFSYVPESDGNNWPVRDNAEQVFCNLGCYRDYHDLPAR